jgi:hypothetical protein
LSRRLRLQFEMQLGGTAEKHQQSLKNKVETMKYGVNSQKLDNGSSKFVQSILTSVPIENLDFDSVYHLGLNLNFGSIPCQKL